MFYLRIITDDCQANLVLGDNYKLIGGVGSPPEQLKRMYEEFQSRHPKAHPYKLSNIRAYIIPDNNYEKAIPVYVDKNYYIMTACGNTYARA